MFPVNRDRLVQQPTMLTLTTPVTTVIHPSALPTTTARSFDIQSGCCFLINLSWQLSRLNSLRSDLCFGSFNPTYQSRGTFPEVLNGGGWEAGDECGLSETRSESRNVNDREMGGVGGRTLQEWNTVRYVSPAKESPRTLYVTGTSPSGRRSMR